MEAQQLWDGLNDPNLKAALEKFFSTQAGERVMRLLRQIRATPRDHDKEAELVGYIEACENGMEDLRDFAKKSLETAQA